MHGGPSHVDLFDPKPDLVKLAGEPIPAIPSAGMRKDLKQRGLWDDTLVIWGGEFGRMPMSESGTGRDHNPWDYTVWLAGGGVSYAQSGDDMASEISRSFNATSPLTPTLIY